MLKLFSRPARLFLFSSMLYGFALTTWELFFNIYVLARGYDKSQLGLINAVAPLASLLLGLPLGVLADRIGRRKAMIIGFAVGIVGMVLQLSVNNLFAILVFGFIQGAAFMLFRVAQAPMMMTLSTAENRAMLFSLNTGLVTLAGALGNLLSGQLPGLISQWFGLADITDWVYRLVILGGLLLGTTCLIPLIIMPHDQKYDAKASKNTTQSTPLWQVFKQRFVVMLFINNLLVSTGAALLIPYLNVFFREKFALPDQTLGVLFAVSSLLVFLGSIISPFLARKLKSKVLMIVLSQGTAVIFMLVLGFAVSPWLAAFSFLMRTMLMQGAAPLLDNFSMELASPEQMARISSIRVVAWQIGWAAGMFTSGQIQLLYGFAPLFITTAVLYMAGNAIVWFYFRPKEKAMASINA